MGSYRIMTRSRKARLPRVDGLEWQWEIQKLTLLGWQWAGNSTYQFKTEAKALELGQREIDKRTRRYPRLMNLNES